MEQSNKSPVTALDVVTDWALAYAARGYHVFPIAEDGKKPLCKWGSEATTDPNRIRDLFTNPPFGRPGEVPNIGVACKPSKLVCVDVDDKPDKPGVENWEALTGGDYGTSCIARSLKNSSKHYVYQADDDFEVRSRNNSLGLGIDVKAAGGEHGGYFVAPNGLTKRDWEGRPWEAAPAKMPEWLLAALKEREASGSPARSAETPSNGSVPSSSTEVDGFRQELRGIDTTIALDEDKLDRVKAALGSIPANDRDVYRDLHYAVHDALDGHPAGIAALHDWARTNHHRNREWCSPAETERIYRGAELPSIARAFGSDRRITESRLWATAYLFGFDDAVAMVRCGSLAAAAKTYEAALEYDKAPVADRLAGFDAARLAHAQAHAREVFRDIGDDPQPSRWSLRETNVLRAALVQLAANRLMQQPKPRDYLLRWAAEVAAGSSAQPGDGFGPTGVAGVLTAEGGVGKTTTLMAAAVSVITGRPWFGFAVDTDRAGQRVLLVLAEECEDEVYRRLHLICEHLGLTHEERENVARQLVVVALKGRPCALAIRDQHGAPQVTDLVSELLDLLQESSEPWAMVVLDPLARMFPAAESDNATATFAVQLVERLTEVQGKPLVLLVHHSSKTARRMGDVDARGVTGLIDAARWVLSLKAKSDGTVEFQQTKSNYSAPMHKPLLLHRDRGGLLRRLTNEELDAIELDDLQAEADQDRDDEDAVLAVLEAAEGRRMRTKAAIAKAVKMNAQRTRQAVDRLVNAGRLLAKRDAWFEAPASGGQNVQTSDAETKDDGTAGGEI